MTPVHYLEYVTVRHMFFRFCVFVTANSALANLLPQSKILEGSRLRWWYELFVDIVAAFALNIRLCLPSLDQEFLGFRRTARHAIRNWRQNRMDAEVR